MAKTIKGKVVFEHIGPGCWGIVDTKGQQWRPVNMPEQIKYVGADVEVVIRKVEEMASIFMWGTPVEIVRFHTLAP
ncbi:MAG: hypothetical protein AAGG75_21885 [Bacteroidota bacterium]